ENILKWYDGYVFDGKTPFNETSLGKVTRVLNPFSIVNFFFKKSFSEYWLRSGPPTFLSKLIAKNPDSFIFKDPPKCSEESLISFVPSSVSPIPLLFQTGYLTLNGVSWADNNEAQYSLKIPNMEVDRGYPKAFYQAYFGDADINELLSQGQRFKAAVLNRDSSAIENILEASLAKISFDQHFSSEKFYNAIFQAIINTLGINVRSQVASSLGKSDLELLFSNGVHVIIEIKFEQEPKYSPELSIEKKREKALSLAQKGLEQIATKEYSKQYILEAKEIIEMGLGVYGRSKVGVKLKDRMVARDHN
ncbi:MAG: PD-(D/E)XK nuclease domain-containing protein, partial [Deltaproteobacteria bacterium]|nr:PD-(D/E)XK nuclease domain-containing protein [Deltaproteobacteria bacterium]